MEATQNPLFDTLASLHEWTVSSILYVKRRNHLTLVEKQRALSRLKQYEVQLTQWIDHYKAESAQLTADFMKKAVERHLQMQFPHNVDARFYEFPPYQLPDTLKPEINNRGLIEVEITGDTRINRVFEGDEVICAPIKYLAELKSGDLLMLLVRSNHRTPRRAQLVRFSSEADNKLFLKYDRSNIADPDKTRKAAFSLFDVIHIYKVISIQREAD